MARLLRIRQVAAIVPDLEPAIDRLHALFDLEPSIREALPQYGLTNAVLPIGDQFLELLQPLDDNSAGARYLAKHGPGLYMLIFEGKDGLRAQADADTLNIPVVATENNERYTSIHFHPKAMSDVLVSIDTSKIENDWPAAGPDWRDFIHSNIVTGIHVFRIAGLDTAAMEKPFADLFDLHTHERAPRGDTHVARARVGHSGTYIDFVTPTSDSAHLAQWVRDHGPGPSGLELQVHSLDVVTERCDALGIGYRPRITNDEAGWQALNLDPSGIFGIPITLVEAHGDANPWELDA